MKYGTVIRTNGTTEILFPKNGTDFKLEELQEIVEGYIELISIPPFYYMVVNEEGALIKLPVNELASSIYNHGPIFGNVLVCEKDMVK